MLKVSYCGRVGSFSHEASTLMFSYAQHLPYNTFIEAITAVEVGTVHYAVIPIENSTAGRVAEIHNILPTMDLLIVREKIIKISHNLYGLTEDISDIDVVESHPQALMQCSKFLVQMNVVQQNALNTAIAAENLAKKQTFKNAVVCSQVAGDYYKLNLLEKNIQNSNENYTTFIAVGKESSKNSLVNPLTSILLTVTNKTGGIYEALGCFAEYNINLLKIESYIQGGMQSEIAQFFLTFEGANKDGHIKQALKKLNSISYAIKDLGSYEADSKRFA